MWEVQHKDCGGNWENTWSYDQGSPVVFDTYHEALGELAMFFEDIKYAVKEGAMPEDHGYRHEDFRIVYVEPMAEAV